MLGELLSPWGCTLKEESSIRSAALSYFEQDLSEGIPSPSDSLRFLLGNK